MALSRRTSAPVHSSAAFAIAAALVLAGCGREGGSAALPDTNRFCRLATELSNEAAARLAPLGANASLEDIARTLRTFVSDHRRGYVQLDRLAPPEIRPALRRQRIAQREFFDADAPSERARAYRAAVRNGTIITDYETRTCL